LLKPVGARHQNACRTKSALQCKVFFESGLQIVESAVAAQALYRINLSAIDLHSQHQASATGHTIDTYRTRTARTMLATNVCTSGTQFMAQKISQQQPGVRMA
jgi:hypothetical protein